MRRMAGTARGLGEAVRHWWAWELSAAAWFIQTVTGRAYYWGLLRPGHVHNGLRLSGWLNRRAIQIVFRKR